ncbi:hypothetical protein BN1182_AC_00260 [Pantoea ananatis]|nr:hypothetical protein BN1182_AC_00260 [Pantoea ananatis]
MTIISDWKSRFYCCQVWSCFICKISREKADLRQVNNPNDESLSGYRRQP